jgi:hypothetical protein
MSAPKDPTASPYAGLAARIRGGRSAAAAEYEERPPSLTISYRRKATLNGFNVLQAAAVAAVNLQSVKFSVELDGQIVGELQPGEHLQLETTAGEHHLRILGMFADSSTRVLQLTNGQRLAFWCQTSLTGIVLEREH